MKRLLKRLIKNICYSHIYGEQAENGAANRQMCYMGNNTVLVRNAYGHKMFLDSRDISLTPHLVMDGYWEKWISEAMRKIVKSGDKVVDIGTNVGYYALLMSELVGPDGFVWAIEANPRMYDLTWSNLQINGYGSYSKVIKCAAFSRNDTLQFKLYDKHMGSSSLYGQDDHAAAYNDALHVIDVQARPLDEILAGERVDFIKIDAEGAEPHIIKGAMETLKRSPHVKLFMEYSPQFYVDELSAQDLLSDLESLGFRFHFIDTSGDFLPVSRADVEAVKDMVELYLER